MQNELTPSFEAREPADTRRVVGSRARVGRCDGSHPEPQIHVNKQQGRIQSLVITCGCGEKIKVVCEYHDG